VRLKHLNVFSQKIHDVSPLSGLIELNFLGLSMTPIREIEAPRHLTNLRTLDLMATMVEDVSALSNLHSLQNLGLWKTHVRDLSPLRNLQGLRTLDIDDTSSTTYDF
jgi:internalin A